MSSLRPPPKLLILLLKIKAPNHSPRAINLAVHGKICRLLSGAFFDRCDHQPRDTNNALVILAGE